MSKIILIYFKGVAMGLADLIPGVSGGTIAFITGIYERLITAIASVDKQGLRLLLRGDVKGLWKHIDGTFLVALLCGIATSIMLLASVILWLKANYPIPLWSFFFGLIVASSVLVASHVKRFSFGLILLCVIGVSFGYIIAVMPPVASPTDMGFLFVSGMIAISAMILPGISGSFILLLLGKYNEILQAITEHDILTLVVFAAGCVLGLMLFARILKFLLRKYHDFMVIFLVGVMLGSLAKVWPWRVVTSTYVDSHGATKPLTEVNVSPFHVAEPMLLSALVAFMCGLIVVGILGTVQSKHHK